MMINEVLEGLGRSNDGTNAAAEKAVGARVKEIVRALPALQTSVSRQCAARSVVPTTLR